MRFKNEGQCLEGDSRALKGLEWARDFQGRVMRKAVKHSVKAFLGESWSQVLFLVVLTCGWACGRAAELDLLSDLRMDFIF